jgi:hypothetical protein
MLKQSFDGRSETIKLQFGAPGNKLRRVSWRELSAD